MPDAWIETDDDRLGSEVVNHIQMVYDPEIPLNVYDLGSNYKIVIGERSCRCDQDPDQRRMPFGRRDSRRHKNGIGRIPSIEPQEIKIAIDPPYTAQMMSKLPDWILD